MLSKNDIKYIQSLGLKKKRDESGLFVAEGPKIVAELIREFPEHIHKVYALETWFKDRDIKSLDTIVINAEELNRISQLQTANTCIALVRQFPMNEPASYHRALYLDTIQDPGNFGTLIRIADWFGVDAVVCSRGCADAYNPKVVQSTMASIGRVHIYYDEHEDWLLKQEKLKLAATLSGEMLLESDVLDEFILMIGNESKGLRKEWIDLATKQVTIPKKGKAESLNAAVATGIILSYLTS
jgi:TrmH family RNA methyltransferase